MCQPSLHPAVSWLGLVQLTLRRVMDTAKAATRSGTISEFSMVLLNNALSFPPAIVMILAFGEYEFILKSYVRRGRPLARCLYCDACAVPPLASQNSTSLHSFRLKGYASPSSVPEF